MRCVPHQQDKLDFPQNESQRQLGKWDRMVQSLPCNRNDLPGQHGQEIADPQSEKRHDSDGLFHVRLPQAVRHQRVCVHEMGLINV